ncbi:hypothetical protein Nepgr_021378 [Nepenthes gracilis]|uniref:non-specific serine/threonine protein kinase n=1 Tax=Nepenthes gracilis TaxID=150966 RepID=A0AAD3SYQ5_NEPGR|nr:hypothetical protein Nepgr_021378 [Nepenthes gracilis]
MLLILIFLLSPLLSLSLNEEGFYLQRVKLGLDDPAGFFADWNESDDTPCNWKGVKCDSATRGVNSIDLANANVTGPFPAVLCRLQNLTFLSLYNNSINSTLPLDISLCENLQHLDLSENLMTGELPGALADLQDLKYLGLSGNNFSGEVPASFGRFKKLEIISLVGNLLGGEFPSFLSNVSTLRQLNLSYNPFLPSELSPELGNLTNLETLWLSRCNLVGQIPYALGQLRKLTVFDLSLNSLQGPIPSSLTELTSIVQIELYNNSLNGNLPNGWSNLTSLRLLDASMNELIGTIPDQLTGLPLSSLNLYENHLTGKLPKNIADSPNLYELKLFSNRLIGELPPNLGENSPLVLVDVSNNFFSGEIPPNLCSKGQLQQLLMIHNSFSGQIPASLAQCRSLNRIRLSINQLSGDVPASFWGLPHLSLLDLVGNSLSGGISNSIASASNLSLLVISKNRFTGQIPEEVGFLNKLVGFLGDDNLFDGSLPASIVNLVQLGQIDLHNNNLSGEIPSGISSWKRLNELNLANNQLSGEIPAEIGNLSALNSLDLSGNQFSGEVPAELQNLKLTQLNLSQNRLSGQLPPLFAEEIYKNSFLDNPGLCGDIAGLCDSRTHEVDRGHTWLLKSVFAVAVLLLLLTLILFYWRYKRAKGAIDRSKWTLMSFHKLGFSEYEILDCLDERNVIGTGASGKVYKAVLSNGEAVAVKKLWGSSCKAADGGHAENGTIQDDGFRAEIETLGMIRHKNIVRLWCSCTTMDCKLLVYEYMPNGSLGDLLHGGKGGLLDWPTRLRIAIDAAVGLSYLHHDCVPPIVHRDVKSNNILLDANFRARVADFGVAKVVAAGGKDPKTMSVIAGSCGYIAPEYAYTLRVNEKSDVYSFGVVILELVTRKHPVGPELGEKDLVKWVCTTIDQKGVDHVIDPVLDSCFNEEICKALNIGLVCTSRLPISRPSMRRVVKMLQEASGENPSKVGGKDGKLTPYYYEDASDPGSMA